VESSAKISRHPTPCLLVAWAVAAVGVTLAEGAHAQGDKEACIRSYEQAQRFRKVTKLVEARSELLVCQEACPSALKADCAQWLDDNDKRVPTLIVDAQDASGHSLSAVRVVADEQLLALHVDDRPIPIDPGEHQLRFESESGPAVVQRIVVREGEKGRRIAVRFEKVVPAPPAPQAESVVPVAPAHASAPPPPPTTESKAPPWFARVPVGTYVGAGVGVLGAIGFAVFGIQRANVESGLEPCKPNCPTSQVDHANGSLFVLTDVSLGLAIAGFGTAAYFYIARREPDAKTSVAAPATTVGIAPTPGGAQASLAGAF
jgi:hypothetical protein